MKGLNLGSSSRVKSECTIPKGSLTLIDSMGTTFRGISEPVFHRTTHSDLDVCTAEESVKEYYEYELVLEEPSLHHSHRYSFPTSKVNDISLKNMETRTTE
jgi:hypothetical protein